MESELGVCISGSGDGGSWVEVEAKTEAEVEAAGTIGEETGSGSWFCAEVEGARVLLN
jgi:hypothetical protein